jgi:membrane associated rhomboid family serine protease
MNYSSAPQLATPPFTRGVKWLVIACVGFWIVFQTLGEGYFGLPVTKYLALFPGRVIESFTVWQLVTYMFLHATSGLSHILLNMLSLWFIGSELEQRWGTRFFLFYYFASGIGAALFYCFGVALFTAFTGSQWGLYIPVMGASGSIFGLLLAFGILFGERTLHFWMIFPMKAKYFVMILGGIEVVSLLNSGVSGGEVANLAHLGGFVAGYLTLISYTRWQQRTKKTKARNLRLVVDNETKNKASGSPKYWN